MNPPSTPPRRPANHASTPRSSSRCHKTPNRSRPMPSPFVTPRTSRKVRSELIEPSPTQAQANFLPTPSTVGSGRKSRIPALPVQKSSKSRNLTATLQALGKPDKIEVRQSTPVTPPRPKTPQEQITREPRTPYSAGLGIWDAEDDKVQVVDVDFLKHIPRKKLPNPFLEPCPSNSIGRPIKLDLATEMELVNRRGERKIEKLSEEQRKFKPRKLDFTSAVNPVKVNYNIANKFVGKTMGKAFSMEDNSKSGFNIFSDGDSSGEA